MRTVIVSDLHLGRVSGEDIARDPVIRNVLLKEVAKADRIVLLGDIVDLFELPLPMALGRARPFFEELGQAMAGRPVVFVPGNHDYRLAEPLLERLKFEQRSLGLEQRAEPSGEAAERIGAWLGSAKLEIAYPGVWLRDDVYATHGHYLDCHRRFPRLECVAAAATMRVGGPLPDRPQPGDYERVLQPVYSLAFSLAQAGLAGRTIRPVAQSWRRISNPGPERRRGRIRRATRGAGIPAGIWGLNRVLSADFDADLSLSSISRSAIVAATELVQRLGVGTTHTITGHTHRGGPDEEEAEWVLPEGGRLHNTGSWVFSSGLCDHHNATLRHYWPGMLTWLDKSGPPRRTRLLRDGHDAELRAAVGRLLLAKPA